MLTHFPLFLSILKLLHLPLNSVLVMPHLFSLSSIISRVIFRDVLEPMLRTDWQILKGWSHCFHFAHPILR